MAEGLDIATLDAPETEILNAPEPAPEAPVAEAVPVVETAERARDPETGKFVAQAPAEIADPPKAAEPVAESPKVIPLAAHIAERQRWEQQIEANKKQLEAVNARLAALEPKTPEPDFIEDPKGYVDAQTRKAQEEVRALKEEANRLQEQQQFAQFQQTVQSHEAEFIKQTADYYEALSHVRNIRIQQMVELYPDVPKEQINHAIGQQELAEAYQFLQRGRNPAEGAYKLAQTYGYKKAEAKPEAPKIQVNVPKAPVADPGSTLGSSAGGGDSEDAEMGEDDMEVVRMAVRERFGARR